MRYLPSNTRVFVLQAVERQRSDWRWSDFPQRGIRHNPWAQDGEEVGVVAPSSDGGDAPLAPPSVASSAAAAAQPSSGRTAAGAAGAVATVAAVAAAARAGSSSSADEGARTSASASASDGAPSSAQATDAASFDGMPNLLSFEHAVIRLLVHAGCAGRSMVRLQ